ncbi:MAG TPA: PA14 domain-containing protein, partial [Saprospiraceae bacterium]|nr:PA14 domain-containing protein [Saprospiraceae bacterium]
MKKHLSIYFFITAILIILSATGCDKNKKISGTDSDRPYQPWVFRSVLDSQARILTLALHDNVWAAYHTDSCSLYKVWKGNVHLQGAVYDNAHGPQPISIGDAWLVNPYKKPWSVMKDGKQVLSEVKYAGHSIKDGKVTLMYNLICNDGTRIRVNEQPEALQNKDGQLGFERKFMVNDIPPGYEVSIAQQVTSIALQRNVETDGKWNVDDEEKSDFEQKQVLTQDGHLILKQGETFFRTYFISTPTIHNTNTLQANEQILSPGERLIAKNDCKTCHNAKVQTIGPAYIHIAERYPYNDETVTMLSNKIIQGGGGIWGTQVMIAHPELPIADANEMVRYILALDSTDVGQEEKSDQNRIALVTKLKEGKDMLPGLFVEAYTNQKGYDKIPSFPSTKKSDQAGIITDFQGLDAIDFGGLTEDFVLTAKGFLYVEKDTQANLRIWSDDGSRVTIDSTIILDNDGLHGTEVKEASISLSQGYHPITIEFMQGKGGRYLSFEWKPDGSTEWTGVPSEALVHSPDIHSKLEGKSLSMDTGKRIPGDQSPLVSVHPSYDLSQARPWEFLPKIGGMDFLSDGRLVVSTWDPSGSVYILSDVDSGDPAKIKVKRIASGLAEPLGLNVIHDTIYILQKQELTRLIDSDGDEMIDEYQCVNKSWPTSANFHEFAFGLAEKEGDLYAALAIAIQPGGASAPNQMPSRGHAVKFDLPSGEL